MKPTLKAKDVLRGKRKEIFELITTRGITTRQLKELVDLNTASINRHIRILEQFGYITSRSHGMMRKMYPVSREIIDDNHVKHDITILKNVAFDDIIIKILKATIKPKTCYDIHVDSGVSTAFIGRIKHKLIKAGLLKIVGRQYIGKHPAKLYQSTISKIHISYDLINDKYESIVELNNLANLWNGVKK